MIKSKRVYKNKTKQDQRNKQGDNMWSADVAFFHNNNAFK